MDGAQHRASTRQRSLLPRRADNKLGFIAHWRLRMMSGTRPRRARSATSARSLLLTVSGEASSAGSFQLVAIALFDLGDDVDPLLGGDVDDLELLVEVELRRGAGRAATPAACTPSCRRAARRESSTSRGSAIAPARSIEHRDRRRRSSSSTRTSIVALELEDAIVGSVLGARVDARRRAPDRSSASALLAPRRDLLHIRRRRARARGLRRARRAARTRAARTSARAPPRRRVDDVLDLAVVVVVVVVGPSRYICKTMT